MYAILTACHLLLVYASLARTSSMQNPFVYLEVLVILVSFVCWVCVIAADTSVEAKQCCSISKAFSVVGHLQTPNSRYCSVCAKNTLGMDHHCLWLNCCIGRCNYRSFLAVLVSVVFQMLLQVVFGLLALVEGAIRHNKTYLNAARQFSGEDLYILEILLAADIIVSATAFVFLASLLLFHVYLIHCRKISTYEWVVRRRYKVNSCCSRSYVFSADALCPSTIFRCRTLTRSCVREARTRGFGRRRGMSGRRKPSAAKSQ